MSVPCEAAWLICIDSKLSQAIQKDVDHIAHVAVPRLEQGVGALQLSHDGERRDKILRWISSSDFPALQSDLIERRQEGTGQWFIEDAAFLDWINGATKTLFCPGIPGAGKTMMAASVIDHLLKTARTSKIGLAYLFCNYKEQESQTIALFLGAILQQIAYRQDLVAEPVAQLYENHTKSKTRPSSKEVYSTIESVLDTCATTYIIVDALDECPNKDGTRTKLLKLLRRLQSQSDVRLMVTSRFVPDIESELTYASKLEVRASHTDVKRYVNGQMYRLPKCVQHDLKLQEEIQHAIADAIDGMFVLGTLFRLSLAYPY